MRNYFVIAAIGGALLAIPSMGAAQDPATGAAVGAGAGAAAGGAVGGPAGAAVGAGVGAATGAAEGSRPRVQEHVVVQPEARTTDRSCVRDAAGNMACTEVRR
jgi:hypothetical protein